MRVGLFFGSFDPPQITICSTCIRNRVKLGIYIQPFVRDTVEAFIDQYRLYV